MREVDEAVRQDQATTFAKKYGFAIGGVLLAGLLAFGAYLIWQSRSEAALEAKSEELVLAIDELEAGNLNQADADLTALSEGTDGHAAMAALTRAGIAIQNGNTELAVELFDRVANNADLPAEVRDIAAIRSVTANWDNLDPQQVIDRLGPMAQASNPYFGSAGELVAHAYLAQDKRDQAGPLLVAIAQNEDVPESLRARTRQLAGLIGFDAIEDVDAALDEITGGAEPTRGEPAVELVE